MFVLLTDGCCCVHVMIKCPLLIVYTGKYINGATMPVDNGMWLSHPRHLSKDGVRQVSRTVEKRSRATPTGLPASKL